MPERVPCPKCSSLSTSLVNKPLFWGKFPDGVEFSCTMCGLLLYGQKALDMVEEWRVNSRDALMASLKSKESERLSGARSRESALRRGITDIREVGFTLPEVPASLPEVRFTLPEVPASLPEVRFTLPEVPASLPEVMFPQPVLSPEEREAKRKERRKEEGARYREKKRQAKQLEKELLEKTLPPPEPKACALEGCANLAREKSKYCSKKCSNKFAHAAEAQRNLLTNKKRVKRKAGPKKGASLFSAG
jgi:hypothetical protein